MDFSRITPYSAEPFEFGPIQTKWLEALESGEWAQTSSYLQRGNAHCCLGVLCKLAELPFHEGNEKTEYLFSQGYGFEFQGSKSNSYLPHGFAETVGLRDERGTFAKVVWLNNLYVASLAGCNDDARMAFQQIAAYIRHDPHNVFTRAA